MNVHISFKAAKHPTVEHEIESHLEKLQRRVQVFRPDLIHLKCLVDHGAGMEGIIVVLNLRLPTGQMAARGTSAKAVVAVKNAFDELYQQFNRHKDMLRDFRRNRREKGNNGREIPFEHTLAAYRLDDSDRRRPVAEVVQVAGRLHDLRQHARQQDPGRGHAQGLRDLISADGG